MRLSDFSIQFYNLFKLFWHQCSHLESLKYVDDDRTILHSAVWLKVIVTNGSMNPTK